MQKDRFPDEFPRFHDPHQVEEWARLEPPQMEIVHVPQGMPYRRGGAMFRALVLLSLGLIVGLLSVLVWDVMERRRDRHQLIKAWETAVKVKPGEITRRLKGGEGSP